MLGETNYMLVKYVETSDVKQSLYYYTCNIVLV